MTSHTHYHAFRAMNCQMTAQVVTDDPRAPEALQAVERLMHQVERDLSRFLPDSDLSRLNAAAGRPYRAGELLWQIVQEALAWASVSHGIFDPTIGRALLAAGYDRSFELLTSGQAMDATSTSFVQASNRSPGWQNIHLDPDQRTITLPPTVQLDLGGIAKGWAADKALDLLRPLGPALVDAGGDLAIGHPRPGEKGWPVAVADPLTPESDLVFLTLAHAGLATSGTDHRRWRHRGRQQHHLIDPHQQQPAHTEILAATVVAPTATEADVLALSLVVMGLHAADAWLKTHSHIPALLILNDGRTYQNSAFAHHAPAYFPAYA